MGNATLHDKNKTSLVQEDISQIFLHDVNSWRKEAARQRDLEQTASLEMDKI